MPYNGINIRSKVLTGSITAIVERNTADDIIANMTTYRNILCQYRETILIAFLSTWCNTSPKDLVKLRRINVLCSPVDNNLQ